MIDWMRSQSWRAVWRRSACVDVSGPAASSTQRWTAMRSEVSGLFSSWATVATRSSRSSSIRRTRVTSWSTTVAPITAPSGPCSGTARGNQKRSPWEEGRRKRLREAARQRTGPCPTGRGSGSAPSPRAPPAPPARGPARSSRRRAARGWPRPRRSSREPGRRGRRSGRGRAGCRSRPAAPGAPGPARRRVLRCSSASLSAIRLKSRARPASSSLPATCARAAKSRWPMRCRGLAQHRDRPQRVLGEAHGRDEAGRERERGGRERQALDAPARDARHDPRAKPSASRSGAWASRIRSRRLTA